MSGRRPPSYFSGVRDRADKRWDQLEADPELAGPWRLLFDQVQSPRHVLSELLQNADDVGAKKAVARITDGLFVFEHDGRDFDEDEFASLCRFGFSNKRTMHTVGFRGVGFKSTFSLGEAVEVLTPTLAVRFHRSRFTEPVWTDESPNCSVTRVGVSIEDSNREHELHKNLQEWVESPASLLFFSHLEELTIGDVSLVKRLVGPGPVANSDRIRLSGRDECEVIVLRSDEESFPESSVAEIRRERSTADLELPPCRVELVVGLPGDNRLFVVLPTGVEIRTPFSCNAPFLQDPARVGIKDPSLSPTNRWLLHRLGRLAADAMKEWLQNESLEIDARAQAYSLLPEKPRESDSLAGSVTSAVCHGFDGPAGESPLLLASDGRLAVPGDCISSPSVGYAVWSPAELLDVFGDGETQVLYAGVPNDHRLRLRSWGWITPLSEDDLIEQLASGNPIPRPADYEKLLALWNWVQRAAVYGWGGLRRRGLAVVPAEGAKVLSRGSDVVRLPQKREGIGDGPWAFLVELVRVVDRGWLQYLGTGSDRDAASEPARELRQGLGLDRTSDLNVVVAAACRSLFRRPHVSIGDHVRIAHLMAALDTKSPESFRCITRDGRQRDLRHGIVASLSPFMDALLPSEWAASHVLHDAYFEVTDACTSRQWADWLRTAGSGFHPFVPLSEKYERIWGRERLEHALVRKGAGPPGFYPYVTQDFRLRDYDFDASLVEFWTNASEGDTWARVLRCALEAPSSYWESRTVASASQVATTGNAKALETQPVVPEWIIRFRGLPCLFDMYDRAHVPAELYLRTPETEPLIGVEAFVRAELDTEATKPLLRLLGARDTPAGLEGLIDRIRALSQAPEPVPLLSEIVKWYRALDAAFARSDSEACRQTVETFATEALILTAAGEWASSREVFQRPSEGDVFEAPLVHPAANDLAMWVRLGVEARPTAHVVLESAWPSALEPAFG